MAFLEFKHFSPTLGMGMRLGVVLPEASQGVGVSAGGGGDGAGIPTLYLLHGTSDDESIWQRRTSVERYAAGRNLAVVMMTTHLGAYTNQQYGFPYFDYVAKEVPEICAAHFGLSRRREEKFIAGLSMGGYGALKIGLALPQEFSYIGALSAGCDRLAFLSDAVKAVPGIEALRAHRADFSETEYKSAMHFFLNFGSPAEFAQNDVDNLFRLAEKAKASGAVLPRILMRCGSEDTLAVGPNRAFHAHLTSLKIAHTYEEFSGVHSWDFWDTHIQTVLDDIAPVVG